MTFDEFKEYISLFDYPKEEKYTLAYAWVHPEYIPKCQISLGKHENVYKFRSYVTNYSFIVSKKPLNKPINVPIIRFKYDLFKNNTIITDIVLNEYINTLSEESFLNCLNLKRIYLNKNITFIPKNCFKGCNELEIYYEGTEEEFNNIRVIYKEKKVIFKPGLYDEITEYIVPGNEAFVNAKVYYNCKFDLSDNDVTYIVIQKELEGILK